MSTTYVAVKNVPWRYCDYFLLTIHSLFCNYFLQNDIVIQQAQYIKNQIPSQQHQQQHHLASGNNQSQGNAGGGGSNDFFNKNQAQDLLAALQTNFTDLNINKEPLVRSNPFFYSISWRLTLVPKECDETIRNLVDLHWLQIRNLSFCHSEIYVIAPEPLILTSWMTYLNL